MRVREHRHRMGLTIGPILVALIGLCGWSREQATRRIDLVQLAPTVPGFQHRLFYVQMDQHGKHLKAGDLWLTVLKSPGNDLFPRCRLILSVPNRARVVPIPVPGRTNQPLRTFFVTPRMTPVVTYEAVCSQDGFSFWGIPDHFAMVNAPTITRFAQVGFMKTRGVTFVDEKGRRARDLCQYGLLERPNGLYTLMFRFQKSGEIGFIYNPKRNTLVGLHLVGQPFSLKGVE